MILGIVLASTVMIVPGAPWSEVAYNYLNIGTLICAAALIAGIVLGYWMCTLEEKYKK